MCIHAQNVCMHINSTGETDADRSAVRELLGNIARAWNSGNATAYSSFFLPGAPYITFMGTVYLGAAEIQRTHAPLFTGFLKGTRMFVELMDISFPAPGVAIVVARGDVAKKKPRKAPKVQSYTLINTDLGWRVALFQNTARKPVYEHIGFFFTPEMKP